MGHKVTCQVRSLVLMCRSEMCQSPLPNSLTNPVPLSPLQSFTAVDPLNNNVKYKKTVPWICLPPELRNEVRRYLPKKTEALLRLPPELRNEVRRYLPKFDLLAAWIAEENPQNADFAYRHQGPLGQGFTSTFIDPYPGPP